MDKKVNEIIFILNTNGDTEANIQKSLFLFKNLLQRIETNTNFIWGNGNRPTKTVGEISEQELYKHIKNGLLGVALHFYIDESKPKTYGRFYYSIIGVQSAYKRLSEGAFFNFDLFCNYILGQESSFIKSKPVVLDLELPSIDE